ncbi:hypothetical protein ACQ4PT_059902 [Festuca glaucescens]
MHKALGDLHVQEISAVGAEVQRLTAEVAEAARKNRQLITISKEREKLMAQARVGYVEEAEVAARLKEADERAVAAEKATKHSQSEVDELTQVLDDKSKELEDLVDAHKEALAAAAKAKDDALATATAACKKQLAAARKVHEAELGMEREASSSTILALQREKTTFEAFVREMSRQLLGTCDFVETATPTECLETATTRIMQCAADILAALQYVCPRERIPHDAQLVFNAVSDVPVVVDWLRRSACWVGTTMALSMVLAHYPEGLDLEEVIAGFPSETGEFDVAEVLRLMDVVRLYADRVLAVADLERHQTSQMAPEDTAKAKQKPEDFPATRLFAATALKELATYPVVKYTPKFTVGADRVEVASDVGPSGSK